MLGGRHKTYMGPHLPEEAREALHTLLESEADALRAAAVQWVSREAVDLHGQRDEIIALVECCFSAWKAYLLDNEYAPLERCVHEAVSWGKHGQQRMSTPQRALLSFKKAVRPRLANKSPSLRLVLIEALDEAYERVIFQLSDAFQEEIVREHVALTKRAEQSREAQTAFLANIGHEVRTPLSSLLGFAELIERNAGMVEAEELAAYLHNLKDNAHHLLNLVDDVVGLSQLESGEMIPQAEDLDLWRLAQDVHSDLKPEALTRVAAFTLDISAALPRYGRLDGAMLARALRSILRAALRLSTRDAHVHTRLVKGMDGQLTAWIEDNGSERIEDRRAWFSGLQQTPNRRGSGPGLAIAVASQLCKILDGRLSVDETRSGFVWVLQIPFAELEDADSTAQVSAPASSPLAHVLILSDSQTPQDVLKEFLATSGMSCAFGQHDRLNAQPRPDVIFTDTTSEISRTLQALATHNELKYIPVVVATAHAPHQRAELMESGVHGVLSKPLDLDELMNALLDAVASPAHF